METTPGPKRKEKLRSTEVPPNKVIPPQRTNYMQNGKEYPDPTPIAPPVGFIKQPPLHDQIKQMVRSEHLRRAARQADMETFEEADDFDVGDDFDPRSPYEEQFEPPADPHPAERDDFVNAIAEGFTKAMEPAPKVEPAPVAPTTPAADPKEPAAKPPASDPITSFLKR